MGKRWKQDAHLVKPFRQGCVVEHQRGSTAVPLKNFAVAVVEVEAHVERRAERGKRIVRRREHGNVNADLLGLANPFCAENLSI